MANEDNKAEAGGTVGLSRHFTIPKGLRVSGFLLSHLSLSLSLSSLSHSLSLSFGL